MSDSHQTTKNSASPIKKSTPAAPQLDQPDVEMEMSEEQDMMDMSVMQRAHASPQSLKPPEVMQLQRLVGNRAVNRLLSGGIVRRKDATQFQPRSEAEAYRAPKVTPIQPARYQTSSPDQPAYAKLRNLPIQAKLTVGPVADEYEKEADRVASQVMSMPSQPAPTHRAAAQDDMQMKPLVQRHEDDDVQMKPLVQRDDMEEDDMQMKPLVQRDDIEEDEMQMKPLQPKRLVTLQRYGSDGQESVQLKRLPSIMRYGSDGEERAQMKPLSIQRYGSDGEEQAQMKPLSVQRFGSDGEEEEMQLKRLIQREVEVRGRKPKTVQRIAPLLLALIPMILPMVMPMIQQMLPQLLGGMSGGGGGGSDDLMGLVGNLGGSMATGALSSLSRKPIVQRKVIQREAGPLPGPDAMSNVQGGLKGSNVTNSQGIDPGGVMQRFQGVMSNMSGMLGGLGGLLGGGANAQMGSGGSIGGLLQLKRLPKSIQLKQPPKSIQRVGDPMGGMTDMLGGAMGAITGAMSGGGGGDDKNLSGMLQRFDGMIGGLGGMLTGLGGMMGGMMGGGGGIMAKASVQREFDGSFQTTSNFETRLHSANMSGNPLPDVVRRDLEPKFGADFSGVRIHTDSQAVQLNREVQARAFTHGSHIHFGAGEYNPGTSAGKSLLAHELTHVVQQTGAGKISPKRLVRLQRKADPQLPVSHQTLVRRDIEVNGRKPKTVQRFLPMLMSMMPMMSGMMGGMGGLTSMMGGMGGMMGGMGGLTSMMGGMGGMMGGMGGLTSMMPMMSSMMGGMGGGMMGGMMRKPLLQRDVEVHGRQPKTVQRIAPLLIALLPMIMPMVMPMIEQMLPMLLGGMSGGGAKG